MAGASSRPLAVGERCPAGSASPTATTRSIHIDVERPAVEVADEPVRALAATHERAADLPWSIRAEALEALDAAHFGV